MMRIVKKHPVSHIRAHFKQGVRQLRGIPLMDHDNVEARQHLTPSILFCNVGGIILRDSKVRIRFSESAERLFAAGLRHKVFQGPALMRLKDNHCMSHRPESPHQTAEKMCISIIPVRTQRVSKVCNPQLTRHTHTPYQAGSCTSFDISLPFVPGKTFAPAAPLSAYTHARTPDLHTAL